MKPGTCNVLTDPDDYCGSPVVPNHDRCVRHLQPPKWLQFGSRVWHVKGLHGSVSDLSRSSVDGTWVVQVTWENLTAERYRLDKLLEIIEDPTRTHDVMTQAVGVDVHMGTKDTNPKDAIGVTKAPMSTIPTPALHLLGLAMLEGALKYGRHNYRRAGIRFSVYYDAVMRHMNAWWEGEDLDPDSGLPHPVKAMACLAIMTDALAMGNANDDRPPHVPQDWMKKANEHAAKLLAKYPNPVPPHTEK